MNKRDITIVVPVSVLPSHPSTEIIEKTIASIRHHLPKNEIILQIDGLRKERIEWKDRYDEFINRVLWKSLHEWNNVLPIVFEDHCHQSTMMKRTINIINTSCILYVEADAPLVIDKDIDWEKCLDKLEYGYANTIRFHFEAFIPKEHQHLMLGMDDEFMKTIQWSQRPHLTTVQYYRDIVLPFLKEQEFIEDRFHGKVQDDGWEKHKVLIYHPEGDIKRSYHLDGRQGTRKFTSDDEAWGYTE
jgi:hypothetical protein